jgi:Histone methylation protein DOT1
VQMRVGLPVMVVGVGVEGQAQSTAKPQEPDRDEQHAHQPFAPGLDQAKVETLLQGHGQGADHEHAQAVSETPARAQDPGSAPPADRQGKERGQVVRAGDHVHHACEKAGSRDEQHRASLADAQAPRKGRASLEVAGIWNLGQPFKEYPERPMPSTSQEVRRALNAVETRARPARGARFAAQAAALELLEVHVLARLQYLEEGPVGLSADLQSLQRQAATLERRLEAANERVVRRLRSRIRSGRYSAAGLRRAFARYAGPPQDPGYDTLDLLVAGLMDAGPQPQERVVLEPDMVGYQPTPARVILALLDRAHIAPIDVVYDLGSGLGWVVILVALLSGAQATGIDLEPAYCEYAECCARQLDAPGVQFIRADAREVPLTGGNVFFMYTPFRGALLRCVLERLRVEAKQRPIRVCTYGPCTTEMPSADWLRPRDNALLNEHEVAVFHSV